MGHIEFEKEHLHIGITTGDPRHAYFNDSLVAMTDIHLEVRDNRTGVACVMNQLLPEGWSISQINHVLYEVDAALAGSTIAIPSRIHQDRKDIDFFATDASFLVLLHEFGHVHDFPRQIREHAKLSAGEKERREKWDMQMCFGGLDGLGFFDRQTKVNELLSIERHCNAYALRALRILREQGLDLEPGVSDATLRAIVNDQLDHAAKRFGKR